jgi:ribose transport system substrate-binding protein
MKKTLSLLLVVVMLLFAVACGEKTEKTDAPAAETEAPAEVTEAAEEKEEADEPADETEAPEEEAEEAEDAPEAGDDALPAADVAEQGFDFYEDAIAYSELAGLLGPIPKPEKEYKLGFTCKAFENEFWRMEKEGAEAAGKALEDAGYNISLDVRAAQGETDEAGQLVVLSDMINKGYDGILVSPIAEGNLLPGVEDALSQEIPMVVVNDAFMPQIKNTVGAWHWEAGQLAAEWVNEKIGGKGQVAIVQGLPKAPPARTRTEAFQKWFEENNPDVEVVAVQNADWDRMKAKNTADVWMQQYPELKAIFANNDTMAMGALESVKEANRLGECFVIGIDGTSEARASIKAGELSATVDSFPFFMSQIGVEVMLRTLAGQDVPKVVYSPQAVIDSTNIDTPPEDVAGFSGIKID